MPIQSNLVKTIRKNKIINNLENFRFHSSQSQHRSNRSTNTLPIHTTNKFRQHIGHGGNCMLISPDTETAFGKIDHTILVLHYIYAILGFLDTKCKLIRSYLSAANNTSALMMGYRAFTRREAGIKVVASDNYYIYIY